MFLTSFSSMVLIFWGSSSNIDKNKTSQFISVITTIIFLREILSLLWQ